MDFTGQAEQAWQKMNAWKQEINQEILKNITKAVCSGEKNPQP